MIRGVLLDWDGIVADTEELHRLSFGEVLEKHGGKKLSKQEWERYCGQGDPVAAKMFVEDFELDTGSQQLFDEKQQVFDRMLSERLDFMPGFKEFFSVIKDLRVIVATGCEREFLEKERKVLGLEVLDYVCVADVGKSKREPDLFLLACEKLKLKPEECVLIEDGLPGIKTAKALGMKTVFLKSYGKRAGADLEVESLHELTEKFEKLL